VVPGLSVEINGRSGKCVGKIWKTYEKMGKWVSKPLFMAGKHSKTLIYTSKNANLTYDRRHVIKKLTKP